VGDSGENAGKQEHEDQQGSPGKSIARFGSGIGAG
jgi:hypothetical protein